MVNLINEFELEVLSVNSDYVLYNIIYKNDTSVEFEYGLYFNIEDFKFKYKDLESYSLQELLPKIISHKLTELNTKKDLLTSLLNIGKFINL